MKTKNVFYPNIREKIGKIPLPFAVDKPCYMYSNVGLSPKNDILLYPKGTSGMVDIDIDLPMQEYQVARRSQRILGVNATFDEFNEMISRIDIMNETVKGNDYHFLEVSQKHDIIYGVFNDDYYVFVDVNKELHMKIITVNQDNKTMPLGGVRAQQEYEDALVCVKRYLDSLKKGEQLL